MRLNNNTLRLCGALSRAAVSRHSVPGTGNARRMTTTFRSSANQRSTATSSSSTGPAATATAAAPQKETPVLDFLEKHGGKVALGGLAATVYLVYTYYLGIEDRKRVEEEVEHRSIIEPYEMLQLRYANNISLAKERNANRVDEESESESESETDVLPQSSFSFSLFREIVNEFRDVPLSATTISYREFVERAQKKIVEYQRRYNIEEGSTLLASGYILDRAVQKKLIQHAHRGENDDIGAQPQCFADIDDVLTIDYLLVLLAQVLPQHFYVQRVKVLFELMGLVDNNDTEADEKNETLSRDAVLHLVSLLQEADQVPPEKQPIETGVKHPVKLYRRKVPEDMVEAKEKALKLETPRERWTEREVFDLLSSYQICAWGMCYKPNDD